MLSRLVCRRNRGANGSKKAASSGSASGEALGTLFIFMLHSTTETNKVVLESRSTNRKHETKEHDSFFLNQCSFDHFPFSPTSLWIPGRANCSKIRTISLGG